MKTKTLNLAPQLKKDWTKEDFKTVEDAIVKYIKRTWLETSHNVPLWSANTFNKLDECLGLAYTKYIIICHVWHL